MSGWPFTPDECPRCRYLERFEPPELDDSGYELVGFCRNPRIAMELFVSKRPGADAVGSCPRFVPAPAGRGPGATRSGTSR